MSGLFKGGDGDNTIKNCGNFLYKNRSTIAGGTFFLALLAVLLYASYACVEAGICRYPENAPGTRP